jgi:phage shock protein PspC (stress-responsive transcriptional regulator)
MLCPVSAKEQCSGNAEDLVKNFVATRPRRPQSGRVIAGVAAGIGRRYAIDPVIVRVALVVSAIYGGAGVIFYLLGWLFLTAEGDEVSPFESLIGRGRSSTSKGLAVILCIALFPAGSFTFGGHFSTAAGVLVLGAALYLLHRYRGNLGVVDEPRPAPVGSDPNASPNANAEADGMTDTTRLGPQDTVPPEFRDQPPAWDPLGAAPFAWDLPEPGPAQQPPAPVRRARSRVGLATVGIVLVTAAVLGAVSPDFGWLTAPNIIGVLAAITGVGLVVGAFTHSGRGLIPLAALLCTAGMYLTVAHFDGWHGAGDAVYQPTTLADVHPRYEESLGNLRVDLSQLPSSGTIHTTASLGTGNLTVIVPDDATVHATCSSGAGDVNCLGLRASGAEAHSDANQPGSGLDITLTAQDGLGQVSVVRASDATITAVPHGGHR